MSSPFILSSDGSRTVSLWDTDRSFSKTEWQRMQSDAARFAWRWLLASVDPKSEKIVFLDPAKAKTGRTRRLTADATVNNLLQWLQAND